MERELEELGAAVRAHREAGHGHRLPKSLKMKVTEIGQRARDAGMPIGRVASLTGVSSQSIQRWTRSNGKPRLVPVRLAADASTVTVVSPDGWRVAGLDVPSAAALLRALR